MRIAAITALLLSLAGTTASAKNMYVPIAGVTPGANGTFFRTDLRIFNPSTERDMDVTLHFLPTGIDGSNIPGRVFVVPKRGVLVLDNVVPTLLEGATQAVGAIRIDSDTDKSYEFIASSRTYTDSTNPSQAGSYGQFIPARDPADARKKTVILHVANQPKFRTNVGAMNPGDTAATLKFRLLGKDGVTVLESAPKEVLPKSMKQFSTFELFGGFYMEDGSITVESSEPVFTWASVIDNFSGDAIFVSGVEDDASVTPLP